jgi:UDPglucose 6-dehydrogenase
MRKVYEPFEKENSVLFFTDIKSAELIKYASNSMLATRISFMNEIARFCDIVGANVCEVSKGMGFDERIGSKVLDAGIGYGGSCFPKDVSALIESGKQCNYNFEILNSVKKVNEEQKIIVVDKILKKIESLDGKKIALWGLAFKPGTGDVREAPAASIAKALLELGAKVTAFDEIAKENFKKAYPQLDVEFCDNAYDAVLGVDCLILVTQWDEFKVLDYTKLKNNMKGNLIVDGRNIYNSNEVRENGFDYIGIGKD